MDWILEEGVESLLISLGVIMTLGLCRRVSLFLQDACGNIEGFSQCLRLTFSGVGKKNHKVSQLKQNKQRTEGKNVNDR